jgi:hypothetical protein
MFLKIRRCAGRGDVSASVVSLKDRDVWDSDFVEPNVDRSLPQRLAVRHRGSVRLLQGKFYTKAEVEAKRKRVMSRPLP